MRVTIPKLFGLFLCSAAVFGQTSAGVGTISSVVTDPSGSAVAGATVIVENPGLGGRRNLKTTSGGLFNAAALAPHSGYVVTIDAPGSAEFKNQDITAKHLLSIR